MNGMNLIDKYILLVYCIVEIYLIYTFFDCFFQKKSWTLERKNLYLMNAGAVFTLYAVNLVGKRELNFAMFMVITMVYVMALFAGKAGSRVLCYIVANSIIFASECLFAIIFNQTNEKNMLMSGVHLEIISLKLLTYIIFVLVEQLIGKSNRKMDNHIFIEYLCLPVAGFGIMAGIFYSGFDFGADVYVKTLITVWFSLLLIGNILVFHAFNRYSEEMYQNAENQLLITKQQADLKYYTQMDEVQGNHNEFIHNMNHYLSMIHNFARQGDCKSIMRAVEEMNGHIEGSETEIFCSHHVLNMILSEKKGQADKSNIEFDVYVEPGVRLDMVSDIDLVALLGNLLDNALRAASECQGRKFVKVHIFMQDIGGFCIIRIVNGYSREIAMHGDMLLSTKNEKGLHGLGIGSVSKIAEKYGGYLSCKMDKDVFTAILLLSTQD